MRYRVVHTTRYDYAAPVSMCYNQAHLTPRTCERQTCLRSTLQVHPVPAVFGQKRTDYFGNEMAYFSVQDPHTSLSITVNSEVELNPVLAPDAATTMPWEQVRDIVQSGADRDALEAYAYVYDSHYVETGAGLAEYAAQDFPPARPVLEGVVDLTRRIYEEFTYSPGSTTIGTPALEVLENRRGVCQDFAHMQIGCLRSIGLAARYVSGYILPKPSDSEQELVGAQASHAWLSVYTPGFGWIDVDPTNNMLPSTEHITLAWARDYKEVSPIRGVILGGGNQQLAVGVQVTRIGN